MINFENGFTEGLIDAMDKIADRVAENQHMMGRALIGGGYEWQCPDCRMFSAGHGGDKACCHCGWPWEE